ncbi:AIRE regulator, partial [Vireo altiloquus]|nr:AIRE regulator [Vireo altiloquus]
DGDLRRLLKLHRTEIAMAVDDVFPLLHGLADHDVVPDHIFKETLSRTEREGSHRAFHALLTWLLGRDAAAVRDFWAVLFKDYNLERYSRLRPLRGAFPREVELGRQRRGRRLSPSPTAPAPHRPQGKRKAPEERDKARAAQPAARHSTSPGMETQGRREMGQAAAPEVSWGAVPPDAHPHNAAGPLVKAKTVKKLEGTDISRTSRASGECQNPQGSFCLWALFAHSLTLCPLPWGQENEDECAACGDGGELICCDGCPRAFHLACLVPPLPHVPSGTWRCGSCVESVAKTGPLLEADLAVERPSEILGEAAQDTQPGGAEGSVCSHCCTRIPTPRHCPAPSGDPRGLLLCTSCMGTLDTGSLGTNAAAGDQLLPAAK